MIRYCVLGCLGLVMAGCSTGGFDRFGGSQNTRLNPAPTAPVESQSLSPLIPNEQYANTQQGQPINNALGAEAEITQPGQISGDMATPATARQLKRTDLLGAWTLASGAEQCKLNVNLTNWTGGYRASTRGCASPDLQRINAWKLEGRKVVLLAEDGATPIAQLFSSSPARFDGLASQDGRAVSLFR
ncbi:Protease inhibitor Inh [Cohaesibacter sp. ES.047]|uniref:AprI/Inh family metalloprotease inhibitor n=1 Tax=Cohaesibacter sp. ES.047 TaxID=1798205 RepID=UPI000BC028E0|nr:AprI/Inh family metalloprotease inhibitor [Cohaesibacter sp. ES.047]SNY90659.1 Protease inhibitor Inh [Cohaesibacter sp. ES.047]